MTPKQVSDAAARYYREIGKKYGQNVQCFPPGETVNVTNCDPRLLFAHLRWMCVAIQREILPDGDIEKAMRWLGFIQGVLWITGVKSIDDMKDDNR